MRRRFAVGLLFVLALGTIGAQGAPNDSVVEARTRALASILRCPVCQGESIQDSPSDLSAQMRDLVREQVRSGRSDQEIKQYFVDRYGEWILLEPTARGANLIIFVVPVLAVLGGLFFVWRIVRRWTAAASPSSKTPSNSTT